MKFASVSSVVGICLTFFALQWTSALAEPFLLGFGEKLGKPLGVSGAFNLGGGEDKKNFVNGSINNLGSFHLQLPKLPSLDKLFPLPLSFKWPFTSPVSVVKWVNTAFPFPGEEFVFPRLELNGSKFIDFILNGLKFGMKLLGLDSIYFPGHFLRIGPFMNKLENIELKGLANLYRAGEVGLNSTITDTKFSWGWVHRNLSVDMDIGWRDLLEDHPNGHVSLFIPYIGVCSVIKIDYATQTFTLDQYEVGVGDITFQVTGLGKFRQKLANSIQDLINWFKNPLLKMFTVSFKLLLNFAINVVYQAARSIAFLG